MHNLTTEPIRLARIAIALCILLVAALTAHARDIHVNDDCSFYDAVIAANENRDKGGCKAGLGPSDTIILTKHDSRRRSLPAITADIIIQGSGRMVTFGDHPAFVVNEGKLTLQNLHVRFHTLRTGVILDIDDSHLTLANTTFHDCSGGMNVKDSTIQLLGDSNVCGHSREIINAWFGVHPPSPSTCEALTGATVTPTSVNSAVQCQKVGPAGVGNDAVIAGGFIDAVDVWGYVGEGVQICFPQVGAMIFLDAATAPRAVSWLESYGANGMTCALLSRAGTVVLVPGEPTSATPPTVVTAPEPATEPAPEPADSEPIVVDGCPIRTTGHINFRAEPSLDAERLGIVLRGSTVGAVSRIRGWYQINFLERTGWIGGRYVDNIGNC